MNKEQKMLDLIVDMVYNILSINKNEIKTEIPIQDLGFTSVELVKLVEKLSEVLDEEIHPGIFFEYGTLERLNDYLFEEKSEAVHAFLKGNTSNMTNTSMSFNENTSQNQEYVLDDQDWSSNLETASPVDVTSASNTENAILGKIPQEIPVIIGGGISGMLISRKLSQKNIKHVIIGKPVLGDSPKLGESMTELVSIEFRKEFKDYDRFFYSKEVSPFYMGNIVSGLRFDFFNTLNSIFREEQEEPIHNFIHIDRIGFDQALYEEVSQSKQCYWIKEMVTDIEYDKKTDQVRSIQVENHGEIVPSFVWDCTNHIRLLGNKIEIPFKNFDEQRQVFFTHYYRKDAQSVCDVNDAPWMHATSLLQAEEGFDGLQGISWLIPLGSYVSVGISMASEDVGDKTPEEVLTLLTKAYQNRGLDYVSHFSRRKEIINVPSQHFAYDRFVGKNWALVGGSAISAWFTSGSNLSIVACMASMADKIIEQPEIYGEHYTRHALGFIQTQKVYDTLLDSDLGAIDAMKFLSGIVEQARKRISSFFMFRKGLESDVAKVGKALWEEEVVIDRAYFNFLKQIATHANPEDRSLQTAEIFKKFSELSDKNAKVALPYLRESAVREEKPALFLESLVITE